MRVAIAQWSAAWTRTAGWGGSTQGCPTGESLGTGELGRLGRFQRFQQFLVLIVDAIALARDLHLLNADSTIFTRAALPHGFEPDACLYIQHARHCAIQSTLI